MTKLFGVITLAFALSAPAHLTAQEVIVDRIVATVNDEVITLSDFFVTVPIFIQLNRVPASAYSTPEGQQQLALRLLQVLVDRELLDQQAEEHEIQIERESVDQYIELIARQQSMTVEELQTGLDERGVMFADFREYIRFELTRLRVIQVMVADSVSVSDAEVDAVFRERYPDTAVETHYDISQIMLSTPASATPEELQTIWDELDAVRQRAVDGESFEELAREYSDDPSRREGGHMDSYARGDLPSTFERTVLNLTTGEVSAIIESRYGYHIVRLNELWEEASIDVDGLREEIYRELQLARQESEVDRYLAQLHDDNIIQVQFDPSELIISGDE